MSLLPLELQSLILTYVKDLEDLITISRVEPKAQALIIETVRELEQGLSYHRLLEYGAWRISSSQLRELNGWLSIGKVGHILYLGLFPHLHVFNLVLPRTKEDIIIPFLGCYYAKHMSFKELTLRCQSTVHALDFLFYHDNSLYLSMDPLLNGRVDVVRESYLDNFFRRVQEILEPDEVLIPYDENPSFVEGRSLVLFRGPLPFQDFSLFHIGKEIEHLDLSFATTLSPVETRKFNKAFSMSLVRDLEEEGLDLTLYQQLVTVNVPFRHTSIPMLVNQLPKLEIVGLLFDVLSEEEWEVITRLLDQHPSLEINVFISKEREKELIPPHPGFTTCLGGTYDEEWYPPKLKSKSQGQLSCQLI